MESTAILNAVRNQVNDTQSDIDISNVLYTHRCINLILKNPKSFLYKKAKYLIEANKSVLLFILKLANVF